MVYVKYLAIETSKSLNQSETLTINKIRTINDSIGVMLRTYARAIQKQENMVGSLFQEHTKAGCLTNPDENDFNWFYKDYELQNNWVLNKKAYPTVCFGYIHENPVKSSLCKSIVDWEFSSAPDYFGWRKGKLINKERAIEFALF